MDAPSSLMDGGSFMRRIVQAVCPSGIDGGLLLSILSPPKGLHRPGEFLRFELLMSALVRSNIDPNLTVLDHIRENEEPNANHYYLAALIRSGVAVMTTNFDRLIELAYKRLFAGEVLKVVYSDDGFPTDGPIADGPDTLWKLHGSIENQDSLGATLFSILAKNISVRKRQFLQAAIRDFNLMVVGYSGSDDLDLIPVLAETDSELKLIWVQHDSELSRIEVEIDGSAVKNRNALADYDLIGRDRIFYKAGIGKLRTPQQTILLTAPTGPWLEVVCQSREISEKPPFELGASKVKGDFFQEWAATLPQDRHVVFEFFSELFLFRRARADVAGWWAEVWPEAIEPKSYLAGSPDEEVSLLIDEYNRGGNDAEWLDTTQRRLQRLKDGVSARGISSARRLSACIDWDRMGAKTGARAFQRAVELDQRSGNESSEFMTLNTWSVFNNTSPLVEVFPEFESESIRLLLSDPEALKRLHSIAEVWKEPECFPVEMSRRKVELAHHLGWFPMLYDHWLESAKGISFGLYICEWPFDIIWIDRLERVIRYCVDMGDVRGEMVALATLGRLHQGRGHLWNAAKQLSRARELRRILANATFDLEGMFLDETWEYVSDVDVSAIQISMWGTTTN